MEKQILTTHEVARYCHVTITTVVNWIKDGSLKAYKTKGGHRRIKRNDLLEFLKKNNMPVLLRQRILVVDDDPAIKTGLQKLFESNGFDVDVASNGFEAGLLIENKRPELVILDLIMPGLDGFAVCEFLRSHTALKHTKIIVLTGYGSEENIKKAKEKGANRCLEKPVDNKQILKEVSTLLGATSDVF